MVDRNGSQLVKYFDAQACNTETYFLGECVRWDAQLGELSWVDVNAGTFYRAVVDGPRVTIVHTYDCGAYLTAVTPFDDRDFGWIIAQGQSLYQLDREGAKHLLAAPEGHNVGRVRTNDGSADPQGRFWIGSMAFGAVAGQGSLYRFSQEEGVTTVMSGVTISNGLGWSPDTSTLYYVDSGPGTLTAYDYDETGSLTRPRVLARLDYPSEGTPDGICVDVDGNIWVAIWGGSEVRHYSPTGELLGRVRVSTSQPSCCALGGPLGTTLYITTAQEDLAVDTLENEPDAGRLFCVDVGVRGLPLLTFDSSRTMRARS